VLKAVARNGIYHRRDQLISRDRFFSDEQDGGRLNLEVDDSLSVSLVLGRGDFEYVVVDYMCWSFRGLVGHELNSGLRHLDGHGIDDHVTLLPNGLRMKFTFCKEIGLMAGTSGRGEVNRPAVHAGRFISAVSQPNRFAKVRDLGVTIYRRRIHVRLQLTCGRDTSS
jgi:hypothetical protein